MAKAAETTTKLDIFSETSGHFAAVSPNHHPLIGRSLNRQTHQSFFFLKAGMSTQHLASLVGICCGHMTAGAAPWWYLDQSYTNQMVMRCVAVCPCCLLLAECHNRRPATASQSRPK